MCRPRVAPLPTIPDLHLTAGRALSVHRPTRWQAQGQLCACRSLSLSLLPEVTSLDLHATEIAADRAVHPSAGSGQAFTDWLAHVRNSAFHRLRCACRGLARRSTWRRPAQRFALHLRREAQRSGVRCKRVLGGITIHPRPICRDNTEDCLNNQNRNH